MQYEAPEATTVSEAEAAVLRNEPDELLHVPIAVSLYALDFEWAQGLCLRLADHPHPNVRGNALLGFGHLARRFRRLDRQQADPLIERGRKDSNLYVRGQAETAEEDIAQFAEAEAEALTGN